MANRRGGSVSAVNRSGTAYKNRGSDTEYTPRRDANAENGTYNKSGAWTDNEILTGADRDRITGIRNQLNSGALTGDQANEKANAIRAGYGYSIDKNGYVTNNGALAKVNDRRKKKGMDLLPESGSTEYYRYLMGTDTSPLAKATGQVKSYDEFVGNTLPTGTADYTEILKELVNQGSGTISGGAPTFSYSYDDEMRSLVDQILGGNLADWKKGDQYAALRDQYSANGEMSMNDLLGQVSSRTGGLASSYAASAANQAYNDWMSKLEQAALEMYQQERSDQISNLGILNDIYSREYGEYQDALSQWNTDRAFGYQKEQDAISNDWRQKEWDYSLSQDDWSKALQQADTLAQYGDFSGYKALGYTDAQISQMQKAWQIQQAIARQKSKSSGSSSGSTSGGNVSGETDANGLFLAAYKSGNPNSFIANNYKKYGFDKSTGLTTDYKNWLEETYDDDASQTASSSFDRLYNGLSISLSEESSKNAEKNLNDFVERYWDYLSDSQRNKVKKLASNYGFGV